MSKFKSFAKSGSFGDYQLIAPDETAKIEKETQRTLRGRQRAQAFLEENNQIFLRAQQLAQGREREQRDQNFRLESENRQAFRDALDRDYDIETQNDRAQAAAKEKTFKDLSAFSKTAFDLYQSVDEEITKNQIKNNAARAYAAGADLATVVSIENLDSNLTQAEFSQIDFIRKKIEEGADAGALWNLYQNRSTRGFINNIAVAQNTAYTKNTSIEIELTEWRRANPSATPEQERIKANQLYREAAADVGNVDGRSLNADLLNQQVFPILRRSETAYLSDLDRREGKWREETLREDLINTLNKKIRVGGPTAAIEYIHTDPSAVKFAIFSDWVVARSKDPTELGIDPEEISEILDKPFPGPNLDANGEPIYTTYRELRAGKEDLTNILQAQKEALLSQNSIYNAEKTRRINEVEVQLKQTHNELLDQNNGVLTPEGLQILRDIAAQVPEHEFKILKFIEENFTAEAKSDAVGVAYLENLQKTGNLTRKEVDRLPLSPSIKEYWQGEADKQESFINTDEVKGYIAEFKSLVEGSPFVKTLPLTGATAWTVKSYINETIRDFKQALIESDGITTFAEVASKFKLDIKNFVGDAENFDLTQDGTGEIKKYLKEAQTGAESFDLKVIQFEEFSRALSNPLFRTDPKFAASAIGAANVYSGIQEMSTTGQAPETFIVGAKLRGETVFEFANWLAKGNNIQGPQYAPIVQQMLDAAHQPDTRRLFVNPTRETVQRAASINNAHLYPVRNNPAQNDLEPGDTIDDRGLVRSQNSKAGPHIRYRGQEALYINFGKYVEGALGFSIGGHEAFGGGDQDPIHSSKGFHGYNEGFDITDQNGDYQGSVNRAALFGDTVRKLGLFAQVINRTTDPTKHGTHTDLGGLLRIPTIEDYAILNQFKDPNYGRDYYGSN